MDGGEEVSALSLQWVENQIFLPQQLQMKELSWETSVCLRRKATEKESEKHTDWDNEQVANPAK